MTVQGPAKRPATVRVAIIGLIGAAVALLLYIIGREHTANYTAGLFGRTGIDAIILKSALATVALGLAVVQVLLALWIYRKLPLAGRAPKPIRVTHRVIGFVAVAVTVPVAIHCFIAYGVVLTDPRIMIHSIAGCVLYGAFLAKRPLVPSRKLPAFALPVAGGLLALVIALLWYTSALWYYNGFSVPI